MIDWQIEQVDVAEVWGVEVVTTLHWRANLSDGDVTVTHYGTVVPQPADDLVPYAGMTRTMALDWLAQILDQTAVEQSLSRALALAQSAQVQPRALDV